MKKIHFYPKIIYFIAISLLSFLYSCSTVKSVKYLRDVPDSATLVEKVTAKYTEPVIMSDDILAISIQTIDPSSSSVANQGQPMPTVGGNTGTAGGQVAGYLVDKNGEVDFPLIGKVKLAGYTTYEAREIIKKKAGLFYKEPSVQVRFANFKVTMLGEVTKPNTYVLPNEKVTILDAISLAGDLTIYGKRENVMLIRDVDGKKEIARLNLSSTDLFKSPYYYLKQNDVIYVEPARSKAAALNADTRSYVTLVLSAISIIVLVIYRLDHK